MWSAGKQTVLTKYTPGYPLETCVLALCGNKGENTQVLILVGSLQHISHCISVVMGGKPPGSYQGTPGALWVHSVGCDDTRCRGEESSDEHINGMWKERVPKEVLQPAKQQVGGGGECFYL